MLEIRRQLLKAFAASPVIAALPGISFAQGLQSLPLGERLWLIQGAGANVVVAEGDASVVVVDGGDLVHADALLAEINRLTGDKPVSVLFNTNWRPEHTGLNHLLGGTGTRIIAHENTRLWQSTDFHVEWEDKNYEPLPKAAQANDTFYKAGRLETDGLTFDYGYIQQAHTDGDIYVYLPDHDVLVVSDLLRDHRYPLMDYRTGGWLGGMRDGSLKLAGLAGEETRVIPAEGRILDRSALVAQHEMLAVAYEVVGDAFRSGWSLEELIASRPGDQLGADWGDAELFLTQAYRGTWLHVPGRAVRNVV